jgi:hypothetical protein
MIKNLLGAAIVGADIIAGMATPAIMAGLHKPHAHLTGPILLYSILGLLTLWVVISVAGAVSGGKPQQRPTYSSFRPGR